MKQYRELVLVVKYSVFDDDCDEINPAEVLREALSLQGVTAKVTDMAINSCTRKSFGRNSRDEITIAKLRGLARDMQAEKVPDYEPRIINIDGDGDWQVHLQNRAPIAIRRRDGCSFWLTYR